jgi:mono/diheme cytochrome c family protein
MNKYTAIGLFALLIIIAALPVYTYLEPYRMHQAQDGLRQRFVAEGATMYVENCAHCHGPTGEGLGAMPALNRPSLATADPEVLYDTIAHSPHGTAMSAWHVDEGGGLNSYQVEGLVTLITGADWTHVAKLAAAKKIAVPTPPPPEVQLATMDATGDDPHECRACHEEPDIHANRFGLNCSRCHTLDAWKPALLTRHVFLLDHGGEGSQACQKCHTETYAENTCYGCHDHVPDEMEVVHAAEEITDLDPCVECHPTGVELEAAMLGYGLSGQAAKGGAPVLDGADQASAWEAPGTGGGGMEGSAGQVTSQEEMSGGR